MLTDRPDWHTMGSAERMLYADILEADGSSVAEAILERPKIEIFVDGRPVPFSLLAEKIQQRVRDARATL